MIQRSLLTDMDRLCVLSFDEVKVREEVDYERKGDIVLLAKRYAQVMMVRGLTSNWKQAIYCGFDDKMNKTTLMSVINALEDNNQTVVAVVSDLGPTNRVCFQELGIDHNNPQFKSDSVRNVVVFSDVPHLLKCIRNHFVDRGFILKGQVYNAQSVLELLARDSEYLRIWPRIWLENVTVTNASRQRVKYAARLLSHSVAQALLAHSGPQAAPTARLIKLVNDWFDVHTSSQVRKDSRCRVQAFGLQLDVRIKILEEAICSNPALH